MWPPARQFLVLSHVYTKNLLLNNFQRLWGSINLNKLCQLNCSLRVVSESISCLLPLCPFQIRYVSLCSLLVGCRILFEHSHIIRAL
jgi:hypothetical protein